MDFQKAPPEMLKDMVCIIYIKRKTAFTSNVYGPISQSQDYQALSRSQHVM